MSSGVTTAASVPPTKRVSGKVLAEVLGGAVIITIMLGMYASLRSDIKDLDKSAKAESQALGQRLGEIESTIQAEVGKVGGAVSELGQDLRKAIRLATLEMLESEARREAGKIGDALNELATQINALADERQKKPLIRQLEALRQVLKTSDGNVRRLQSGITAVRTALTQRGYVD